MGVDCGIKEGLNSIAWLVSLVLKPGIEHICRHIVGSLAVNRISIHFHFELFILQVHLNSSNTKGDFSLIHDFANPLCYQLHFEIVNMWLSNTVGPP